MSLSTFSLQINICKILRNKLKIRGVFYMEITVIKGSIDYIDDCEEALVNSELGKRYFSEKGKARKALLEKH